MRLLSFLVVVLLASGAFAQDAERLEAARAYVNSKGQQELMADMLSPEGVMGQMGLVGGRIPDGKKELLARIVSEELAKMKPVMEEAMISGMATTFTLDEIQALTEFYASDVGASAIKKMTPFMTQTMQQIGPHFQQMQAVLARRIQEEMSK
ncbi:DUF2059 domain-containing protein [Roseobacter sp. S98]|uniref:DUF2059 domain-containing protein n=1 Tax=Roseobacter algicola (ex Choi et al. 2025) (nom. illeg.) TaxID=3092138 RepID=UPI0035C73743